MDSELAKLSTEDAANHIKCLDNAFYLGETDFRLTARCTVQNWLLLAFSIILMTTILAKCKFSVVTYMRREG
jgi:chitin synthase